MRRFLTLLASLTLGSCTTVQETVPASPGSSSLINKMEAEIVSKVVADVQADLANRFPEYATILGGGTGAGSRDGSRDGAATGDWNPPGSTPLATNIYVDAANLLGRSVDTTRLPAAALADIGRLGFAADLQADAQRFSHYQLITGTSNPVTRMAAFLVHSQPADSADALREYISRVSRIDAATAALLDGARAVTINRGSLVLACNPSGVAAELMEDFLTHLQHVTLTAADRANMAEQAGSAITRAIPAACEMLKAVPDEISGLWQLDESGDFYGYLLRAYSGTRQTSVDVFAIAEAGLRETLPAEDTRPGDSPLAPQELLNRASEIVLDLDAERNRWSDLMPWTDLDIRIMPDYLAAECACTASYIPGTPTSPTATIYLDRALPPPVLKTIIASNSIPGRHLVPAPGTSEALDLSGWTSGWAAYSALLVDNPAVSRMLHREVYARAAVDVGIHSLRWQPDEAVRFLEEQRLETSVSAAAIVESIRNDPGRAAAVAVGLDWFKQARIRTLDQFSDKAFTDLVLANGPVPFSVLDQIFASPAVPTRTAGNLRQPGDTQ